MLPTGKIQEERKMEERKRGLNFSGRVLKH
jgi:hypothetical protein